VKNERSVHLLLPLLGIKSCAGQAPKISTTHHTSHFSSLYIIARRNLAVPTERLLTYVGIRTNSRNHTTYVESACAHQGLWSGTAYNYLTYIIEALAAATISFYCCSINYHSQPACLILVILLLTSLPQHRGNPLFILEADDSPDQDTKKVMNARITDGTREAYKKCLVKVMLWAFDNLDQYGNIFTHRLWTK
jgi:hypothetical protein